ncbi:MAG: hypothetical protein ACOYOQ_16580, partial [Microthrixaceae bacterium]
KGPVEFRAGESNEFGVILTRADGSPVPSESVSGKVTVSGSVTNPATGQEQDLGEFRQEAGRWVGAYDAPLDLTVPNVNVTLRAAVTTRSGVALPPVVASSAVPLLPPVGYPQVLTRTLRVGPVVGVDPARGVIQLKGSPRARTCVWLDGVSYDPGPVTAKELKWRVAGKGAGSGDCVQLDRSGSGQLELEFTPSEATRAITTGTIGLSTRPLDSDDARATQVGLEVQLVKPASAEVAWAIFLALLLIGVGVPLAAFYVSNWVVAKFAPLRLLQGCDVRILVDDRGVTRAEPLPNGALFNPDEFSNQGFGGAANGGERIRKFAFDGVPFSSAVSSNPFRPPFGRAGDGTAVVLGSARGTTAGPYGRVSLWVTREWVFLPDEVTDPEAPVTGRLIAFVLATERMAAIGHLETSLRDRLPALVDLARSRRTVRVVEVAPEMPPSGGGQGTVWNDGPGPAGSGPVPPGSTSSPVWETGAGSTTVTAPQPPPPPPGPTPPQPTGPWPGPDGPADNRNDIWGDGPGRV